MIYEGVIWLVIFLCIIGIVYILLQIIQILKNKDNQENYRSYLEGKKEISNYIQNYKMDNQLKYYNSNWVMEQNSKKYDDNTKSDEFLTFDLDITENVFNENLLKATLIYNEKHYSIDSEIFMIGRGKECNLTIDEKSVSRRHVLIIYKNGEYEAVGMRSLNGTWINGIKLGDTEKVKLNDGDIIKVVQEELKFEVHK